MKAIGHVLRVVLIVGIGMNALYFLAGSVWFPAYVRKTIIRELAKNGTGDATIERVAFNPYTFELFLSDCRFHDRTSGFLFSAEALSVDFSPISSLRSGMPVFTDILLLDAKATYVKRSVLSPFFDFLRSFDWSVIPQFRIDHAKVLHAGIQYENTVMAKKFSLGVEALDMELERFVMHGDGVNSVRLAAMTVDGESLRVSACFDLEPYGISGEAFFDGLLLRNYEPYIGLLDGYSVVDGSISGSSLFDFDSSAADRNAFLGGLSFTVDSLCVKKTGQYRESFGFGLGAVEGADIDLSNGRIDFESVDMIDGSLDLDPFLSAAKAESGRLRGSAKWDSLAIGRTSMHFDPPVHSIGSSAVRGGSVEIFDETGDPPGRLSVEDIDISLGGFFSDASRLSDISVDAKTGVDGSVRIYGETNPFAFSNLARFRLLAQNVDIAAFSPYTEKYLGYPLNDGDLRLDMNFLIKEGNLTVRNKLFLDRVEVGEKQATASFPIPLAVALLEDSRGRIELDVPVEGTMAEPGVDVGKSLVEAVFRPFGILCGWLAGEVGTRYRMDFPGGISAVDGQDTRILDDLIARLEDAPGSVIDIEGSVDEWKEAGDLSVLADGRAASVKEYFVVKGKIAEERIFVLESRPGMAVMEGSCVYLNLDMPVTD